jgi:hypothetical protein
MSTMQPKPFVFVLMPFDPRFNDIYKFGIKGAADEVGAYAERVDEQIFGEGILDRIFNQISKADVIVADMTGRNPNVFYEVGYAHALGKTVLLLTQSTDDIPFDLKHRQHIVYGGQIESLRRELGPKLQWAIAESRKQQRPGGTESFSIRIGPLEIPRSDPASFDRDTLPRIYGRIRQRHFAVPILLSNDSLEAVLAITHVYLFCEPDAMVIPRERDPREGYIGMVGTHIVQGPSGILAEEEEHDEEDEEERGEGPRGLGASLTFHSPAGSWGGAERAFKARPSDALDGLGEQFKLKIKFSALPPGAVDEGVMYLLPRRDVKSADGVYRLRLHSSKQFCDFTFRLSLVFVPPEKKEPAEEMYP